MEKKRLFAWAVKQSIPVMLGYIFLGIAYGIVQQEAGLGVAWALLISGLVYAGSMQFALVPLLTAGTPLPVIALMTLMVNCRHLFYGLSFVDTFREMGKKYPYMIFSLTDETYSLLVSCKDDSMMQERNHLACFYISALDQFYWVLGSVIGALAGSMLTFDTTGIDFAMTALFVVILVDQLRSGRRAWACAALGLALGVVFLLLVGADDFLLPTLLCTMVGLAAMDRYHVRKEAA